MAVLETLVRQLAAGGVARHAAPPPTAAPDPPVPVRVTVRRPDHGASARGAHRDCPEAPPIASAAPGDPPTARPSLGPPPPAVGPRQPGRLDRPPDLCARLRALGWPARLPRHRCRRAPPRRRLPAQALVRPQLDLADAALPGRGCRGDRGGGTGLATRAPVPDLWSGAHRGRRRDHLPEHLGRVTALRGAAAGQRDHGARARLRGPRDDRLRDNVEALGVTAALGAFFAPVLLGQNRNNADLLLLYLASMAAGLGLVSARRRWRLAAFVIAASYFGVGTIGAADHANPWGVLLFGLIGGTAGLYVGLRERWWETRLLTFSVAGRCSPPRRAHPAALGGARGRHRALAPGLVVRAPAAPSSSRCTSGRRARAPAGWRARHSTSSSRRCCWGGRCTASTPTASTPARGSPRSSCRSRISWPAISGPARVRGHRRGGDGHRRGPTLGRGAAGLGVAGSRGALGRARSAARPHRRSLVRSHLLARRAPAALRWRPRAPRPTADEGAVVRAPDARGAIEELLQRGEQGDGARTSPSVRPRRRSRAAHSTRAQQRPDLRHPVPALDRGDAHGRRADRRERRPGPEIAGQRYGTDTMSGASHGLALKRSASRPCTAHPSSTGVTKK